MPVSRLHAVGPNDTPPRKRAPRPKTVTQAARRGTQRELLEAMRDRIAKAVENPNTPARDLAALTKRLIETVREIKALDAREDAEHASSAGEVEDGEFDASAV